MAWLIAFNVLTLLACAATIAGVMPKVLYVGFLRGLHGSIGITTPTDRQLRWVLLAWLVSTLVIVDGMVLLMVYVF